jgi:hypothetical protein
VHCFGQLTAVHFVGQPPGQELIQNHSQRVDVATSVHLERVTQHLLGTHVGEGSHKLAQACLHCRLRVTLLHVCIGDARHSEIENLGLAGSIDQNVAWFQIAVN